MAGAIPGIYPYIVDGVGEGIQAKRRGLAVMVSHLTPPLSTTELYDDLLACANSSKVLRRQILTRIRLSESVQSPLSVNELMHSISEMNLS